jgi:DNA-binding NarL/FixJ family response regulator
MIKKGTPTVMIVEDHSVVHALTQQLLRIALPQCRFVNASSGEQAVAMVARENPDLVIMDIQMQGMNGIEATGKIKAAHPEIKVLILSNHEESEYMTLAAREGASAFVPKRLVHQWLVPLVKKFLGESAPSRTAPDWLPGELLPGQGKQ